MQVHKQQQPFKELQKVGLYKVKGKLTELKEQVMCLISNKKQVKEA